MKYPYAVKFDGKWYRPNTEVPDENTVPEKTVGTAPTHPPDEKKGGKKK